MKIAQGSRNNCFTISLIVSLIAFVFLFFLFFVFFLDLVFLCLYIYYYYYYYYYFNFPSICAVLQSPDLVKAALNNG